MAIRRSRAKTLDRKMDNMLKTYIAVLPELTPEQIVIAFSRAVNESNFSHALATLCNQ
jgi:hypothetical protein